MSECRTAFGVPVTKPRAASTALVASGLLAASAARFGFTWALLPTAVLVVAAALLSAIDLATFRLPDPLVFAALGLSLAAITVAASAAGRVDSLRHAAAGMALFFVLLLAAHLVSPRGLGFGDVKLGLLLGLHLGWAAGTKEATAAGQGVSGADQTTAAAGDVGQAAWPAVLTAVVPSVLAALAVACLLGVLWGLAVGLARRSGPLRSQAFAFGPALAAGTLIVLFLGDRL